MTWGCRPDALREHAPPALLVDQGLADVEEDRLQSGLTRQWCPQPTTPRLDRFTIFEPRRDQREIAGVVTFSRRRSPSTTRIRPPRASTSEAQSVASSGSIAAIRGAEDVGDECLRRLHGDERGAVERLDRDSPLDPLDGVGERQAGDGAVVALGERREHALDHVVGDERPSRVVDEDDERVVGDLGERGADRLRPCAAARDDGCDLRGDELLGEHDRGFLPLGRNGHDDGVDPVVAIEPLEALRQEDPRSESDERLRPIRTQTLARACGDEDRPGRAVTTLTRPGHRPIPARNLGRRAGGDAVRHALAVATLAFGLTFRLPPAGLASTSSSQAAASSSVMSLAYMNSEARIFFAFTYICFSPVDSPFS